MDSDQLVTSVLPAPMLAIGRTMFGHSSPESSSLARCKSSPSTPVPSRGQGGLVPLTTCGHGYSVTFEMAGFIKRGCRLTVGECC